MKIETKFDIGQEVWVISNNKVINNKIEIISIFSDKILYSIKGNKPSHINEIFSEKEVFATKKELLDSL